MRTLLAHGASPHLPLKDWTPTRRQSSDFHFEPELVGATPFWLAARFTQPAVMRLLVERGADPLFVHRSDRIVDGRGGKAYEHQLQATTALMAAVGMGGGGTAWVPVERSQREALALETVKLASSYGIDVNAANTDGRTALDAAKALKFERVAAYLDRERRQARRHRQERRAATARTTLNHFLRAASKPDKKFSWRLAHLLSSHRASPVAGCGPAGTPASQIGGACRPACLWPQTQRTATRAQITKS